MSGTVIASIAGQFQVLYDTSQVNSVFVVVSSGRGPTLPHPSHTP